MAIHSVPFFSLERQKDNLRSKLISSFERVIDSQQFIGGPLVEGFEKNFAKFCGVNHAIGCNSGTDALWMALHALGTPKDSIVLTTPFSFIASSSEIVLHEANPVFIDVDSKTFNLCPKNLKLWLETNAIMRENKSYHKQTGQIIVGIVTVDLFGQLADYKKIREIANEWNLWILEDACQAVGAEVDGKKAGTFGDIAAFSFYPTKNLGGIGDGGCCTTSNQELADKLLFLRNHGRKTAYDYTGLGINSRLDALQATVLDIKLQYLDKWNKRRKEIAQFYNQELAGLPFITTPLPYNGTHVYHQYSIIVADKLENSYRNELASHLSNNKIGTRIFYEQSFTQINFLNTDKRLTNSCPVAENLTKTILSLPVWPELTDEEVEYVANKIKAAPLLDSPKLSATHAECAC